MQLTLLILIDLSVSKHACRICCLGNTAAIFNCVNIDLNCFFLFFFAFMSELSKKYIRFISYLICPKQNYGKNKFWIPINFGAIKKCWSKKDEFRVFFY